MVRRLFFMSAKIWVTSTHSKGYWRIAGTVQAKKMRQDGVIEFIRDSLIFSLHWTWIMVQ